MNASEIKSWWNQIHPLWLIALPTALALVVTGSLMLWSIPVFVHVELTTQRIEFVVDPRQAVTETILEGLDLHSVGIEKLRSVTFMPDSIKVANPSCYSLEKDTFPPSAWKRLTVTQPRVGFEPNESTHFRITVEEDGVPGKTGLRLDPIGISPGVRVSIETRGGKDEGLAIAVAGQSNMYLSLRGPFTLIAENARTTGIGGPVYDRSAELTYSVRLRESAPSIEIAAQRDGLVILPVIRNGPKTTDLASQVPVSALEFTRQGPFGERVSALTGKGSITFPQYPKLGSVAMSDSEVVGLEGLDKFSINKLTLSPGEHGMSLVGEGMAVQIRTRTGQIPIERHVTAFDALSQSSKLAALVAIIGWMVPTAIGLQRFFKDLKH
jgi:hypothetical protein